MANLSGKSLNLIAKEANTTKCVKSLEELRKLWLPMSTKKTDNETNQKLIRRLNGFKVNYVLAISYF